MRALWLAALWPGLAFAQQVDCANAVAQVELTFCAGQDLEAADADLNAAYAEARSLMRRVDADLSQAQRGAEVALRDAQRAWITYRDNACLAEAYLWFGGTGQSMAHLACQARLTQMRADDLWMLVSEGG